MLDLIFGRVGKTIFCKLVAISYQQVLVHGERHMMQFCNQRSMSLLNKLGFARECVFGRHRRFPLHTGKNLWYTG